MFDNAVAKIDFNLHERHSSAAMYFFGNNSGTVEDFPELQPKWLSKIHTRAQVLGENWTYTPSASWVNEARIGYNRLYQPTFPDDHNIPAAPYGLNTGVSGNPLRAYHASTLAAFIFPTGLVDLNGPKFQGPDYITFNLSITSPTSPVSISLNSAANMHYDGCCSGGAYGNARGSITFLGGVRSDAGVDRSQARRFPCWFALQMPAY